MKSFFLRLVLVTLSTATLSPAAENIEMVSEIGSERATSGAGAKIATFEGKTHVVWQDRDDEGGYLNRVRTLDRASGKWTGPVTLNRGKDNHARPVLTVGENGILHVVLSGHNSPVTYRHSLRPNDSSEWSPPETIGHGTYPAVACGADGRLVVTMRSAPKWNGVDCYIKDPGEPWKLSRKIFIRDPKLPGYAGYQTGLAWGPDRRTLHFVADFYESIETYRLRGVHQAVCYLRSPDGGISWEKADGTKVEPQARPEHMDIIVRSEGDRGQKLPPPWILAQGSIVCDAKGTPHVFYISHLEKPGQALVASPDGRGRWNSREIDAIEKAEPGYRPAGCRGSWSIDSEGGMHALLELHSLESGWTDDGKPTRSLMFATEGKKLVWLTSPDGKNFSVLPALPANRSFNEQNVERPTGFNLPGKGRPPFLFFDGESRYPKGKEILQNGVFLVLP
ncbi:MAG: hypothetical protein HKN23_08455 [Verrucomicrobiales bacterium]|nr:hypothetical protein [Verrucomicrobiales bacterium]